MLEEYGFELNKVNINNIAAISSRQSEFEERRIIELDEMARELAEVLSPFVREMNGAEILSLLADSFVIPELAIHPDALQINYPRLRAFLNTLSVFDRLLFSDLLTDRLKKNGCKIDITDFLPENDSSPSFVYVKNPLSDEAYDIFSDGFTDPRIRYAQSIREAAKMVSDGVCSYVILPFEESGNLRLKSTSELIYEFDLKINAITPVFGLDGRSDMKFALVSGRFTIPSVSADDDLYLEIRAFCDTPALSELLMAVGYYNAVIYRINSVTSNSNSQSESYYSVVIKSETGDFVGLMSFLTLFTKSYTPVGIYKNLE